MDKNKPLFRHDSCRRINGKLWSNFSTGIDISLIPLFDSCTLPIDHVRLEDDADVGLKNYGGNFSYEESRKYPWLESRVCQFVFCNGIRVYLDSGDVEGEFRLLFTVCGAAADFDLNTIFGYPPTELKKPE